eukprot:Selendium_serpulae@DN6178_c0_g2_i1.p1
MVVKVASVTFVWLVTAFMVSVVAGDAPSIGIRSSSSYDERSSFYDESEGAMNGRSLQFRNFELERELPRSVMRPVHPNPAAPIGVGTPASVYGNANYRSQAFQQYRAGRLFGMHR